MLKMLLHDIGFVVALLYLVVFVLGMGWFFCALTNALSQQFFGKKVF